MDAATVVELDLLRELAGRLKAVSVTVRTLPVPADLLPQQDQPVQRAQVQKWIGALWQEKDAELSRLLGS